MTRTHIDLDLGRAFWQLVLLVVVVVVVGSLLVSAGLAYAPLFVALPAAALLVQLWATKILFRCTTITTTPLTEAEAEEATKREAPSVKPKPKSGMKLDARRD